VADSPFADKRRHRALEELDVSPAYVRRDQARLSSLLHALDVAAPPSLQHAVSELIASASHPQRPARRVKDRAAPALASLAATVAIAGVLALPGGASSPSVAQAALLTLRPSTAPAPVQSATRPTQLARSAQGIAFPDLAHRFGWRSAGTRSDTLNGRKTTTVFYVNETGQRIGYEIVSGTALQVSQEHATQYDGITYRALEVTGLRLVTWQRDGHTCILAGRDVDTRILLALANWSNA